MLLFRYLSREILTTLSLLISILVVAILSNQLIRFLSDAAAGKLQLADVFSILLVILPQLVGLLLPLALFFAILLVLGRMYADNEMTVFYACGLTPAKLITMILCIASVVAAVVAYLVLSLGPSVVAQKYRILHKSGTALIANTLVPGEFHQFGGTGQVVYVENMDGKKLQHIFIARRIPRHPDQWEVLSAKRGRIAAKEDEAEYFLAQNGVLTQGKPGSPDFRVTEYKQLGLELNEEQPEQASRAKALPTQALWPVNNPDPRAAAELQWRLSFPILTLILALLAIPLSRLQPRQGKYAKILPAALVAVLYANALFVVRGWIQHGRLSADIGIWWLHGIAFLFACGLLFLPSWRQRWRYWRGASA